jgi:hypothetical protein
MEFLTQNSVIFLLVALNYTLVAVSLVHLIFWTHYNVYQRLAWMVALWLVPVLGPAAYWLVWHRSKSRL